MTDISRGEPHAYRDGSQALIGELFPPLHEANGRAVLVIHEADGIGGNVRRHCARLADLGYVALAAEARDREQLFEVIAKLDDPALRLDDIKAHALRFDAAHIADQVRRMEDSIVKDPALAIGTAKELVESCFKTILRERGIDYDKEDLPQLGKKVFGALRLLPNDIPEAARGAKTIKTMLSNLATVVQGVAEIRSLYGTGHGRDGKARGVTPRHARLAVGAATTLVNFAFETHLESPASEFHVHKTSQEHRA